MMNATELKMNWNLEGMGVVGRYMGEFPVEGVVHLSRVKYGGTISHHVTLNTPTMVYGALRESVILEHHEVEQVFDAEPVAE
jgi:hypothetical protein